MDCTYCYDSGMAKHVIRAAFGIADTWMICGCAAGAKIASRIALRSRIGLEVSSGSSADPAQLRLTARLEQVRAWAKATLPDEWKDRLNEIIDGKVSVPIPVKATPPAEAWLKLKVIVEAQKAKEWALGDRPGTIHSIRGWAFGNVLAWMRAIEAGEDPTPKDPAQVVAEIQAEAKRAGTDKLTDAEINAEIAASRAERKIKLADEWPKGKVWRPTPAEKAEAAKTPADRLADAALDLISSLTSKGYHPGVGRIGALDEAITEYRSTRNAYPSFNAIVGNPPDPIMLARLTVDSLTGGALSSLICQVIDDVLHRAAFDGPGALGSTIRENLVANLRALGEDP